MTIESTSAGGISQARGDASANSVDQSYRLGAVSPFSSAAKSAERAPSLTT